MNKKEQLAECKQRNMKNTLDAAAVKALILRVTGREVYSNHIEIESLQGRTGYDAFRLFSRDGKIVIQATNGIAACVAFRHYLTQECHCQFGPITKNMHLPQVPPMVSEPVERETPFLYRYFMNYCTFSYTYLFSGWEDYERLTDWMLMSGVNLSLNILGHELVWRDVLQALGYSREEIDGFICGPAYLPWQWMGNMTGFGGNLTDNWYEKQKKLSNRFTEKLRSFGAEVILPGYFGMVPLNFGEKFPQSKPIVQGGWCNAFERPPLIQPSDPMFDKISDLFYEKTKEHFGDCKYFSGDPFHEGGSMEGIDLKAYGLGVIGKMKQHCPDGIWFLQGWTGTPKRDMLKALQDTDVLIGSLSADNQYHQSDDFCGYPWLYCTTTSFGGARKMSGNLSGFLSEPLDVLSEHPPYTVVGTGMTMEAVENDEVLFDIFGTINFADRKLSVSEYLRQFVTARYGTATEKGIEAYQLIAEYVLSLSSLSLFGSKESVLCARPSLEVKNVSTWGNDQPISYEPWVLPKVAELLLSEYDKLQHIEGYRLDLMDVTRQAIADKGWSCLAQLKEAYDAADKQRFLEYKEQFLSLFEVQEALMATNSRTLLGSWLKKAENYADSPEEQEQYCFNAMNLITLWASREGSVELRDYGHREWSGMLRDFYGVRWERYLNQLAEHFDNRQAIPEIDWTAFDYDFVMREKHYEDKPNGDLQTAVQNALKKL